jgi:hypothetical protein
MQIAAVRRVSLDILSERLAFFEDAHALLADGADFRLDRLAFGGYFLIAE